MAYKKKLKTRLDLLREEADNSVYVVAVDGKEVSDGKSKSASGKNIYTTGAQSILQGDIAPIKTTTSNSSKSEEEKWYKRWNRSFEDGYDVGDLSKKIIGVVTNTGVKLVKAIKDDPIQTLKSTVIGAFDGAKDTDNSINNAFNDLMGSITGKDYSESKGLTVEEFNSLNSSISEEEKTKILQETKELYGEDSDYYKAVAHKLNTEAQDPNIFTWEYTDSQTYKDATSGNLSEEQQEVYNIARTGGQQLIPIAATILTGNPAVGKVIFYTQAQQNYTEQAKQEGKTDVEARVYGLAMGGFEMLTEKLGFDEVGGQLTKATLLKSIKGEALEEAIMPYIESGYKSIAFDEEFDLAGTTNEAVDGAVYGGILGGVMSMGGKGYVKTDALIEKINSGKQIDSDTLKESINEIEEQNPGYFKGIIDQAVKTATKSEYTQNEQSVIEKVVSDKIAEAEQDGKKLTNKQINAITDEIYNDLDKGYISTDTIESVLGGDTYTQLQSIKDNKSSIEQEISELENKPYAELTVKENDRLKALREELSSIDTNTLEAQLQSEMTEKIAKDDYLQRSYQEQAKKGQQFTYEADKITNENEKAVYESATKYMNNTNRSHEFVEKVAKIASDKGTNYEFINNEELKKNNLLVEKQNLTDEEKAQIKKLESELKQTSTETQKQKIQSQIDHIKYYFPDGLITKEGKVLINIDSAKALNTIVGHETTHLLEGTEEYKALQNAIFNYAKEKGDYNERYDNLSALYQNVKNADIDSELTADLVGDYLFTDENFINNLSTQNPTIFQRIKELIDDLVVKFTGTKEEKALREVQKKFKAAYKQQAKSTDANTKFSVNYNVDTMTEDDAIDTMKHLSSIEGTRELNRDEKDLRQEIINKYLLSSDKFSDYLRGWVNEKHSKDSIEVEEKTTNKANIKKYDTKQSDIQGLENYREGDIEDAIFQDIENKLAEYGYGDEDIEIDSIYLHGSRKRGTAKTDSDLDVVLFYTGEADDVGLFNDLNENRLNIDGIEIDVNPINLADESSESYIARSEAYDKEVIAGGGAKYSLTDNQGRTLTKEQQEYFKDSKVRDENGNLLTMYHGTRADFNVFDINRSGQNYENNWSASGKGHYFTENKYSAEDWAGASIENDTIKVKESYINIKNPFYSYEPYTEELSQLKDKYNIDDTTLDRGYKLIHFLNKNGYDSTTVLQELGYDGIFESTRNEKIDEIVVFNSNQIKNIDNTNPTSDEDIRYSLTPDYGMSHRPSTDYGDASNFEENMPDVFEHPEWYMFGGDSWYKKAYNESWNALKKVRNNPDGEITIYRATIGDTFNEGDWVSPSKAYAEWHNYSNLEGKGKVIELKVKAKDIRFAGDDLNEFGYFPNGVDEYSLSRFNEQRAKAKGNYNVYGEDVKYIAPLQEEIKTLTETVNELKEQIAPISGQVSGQVSGQDTQIEYTQPTKAELDNLMTLQETGGTEYANEFFRLRDKYGQPKLYKGINEYKKAPDTYEAPIKGDEFAPTPQNIVEQQGQEAFDNIDESNMPEIEDITPDVVEGIEEPKSLFETRNYEDMGDRKVNAYQYDNPEVKPFFQQEAQAMLGDLQGSIKGQRSYNDQLYYDTNGEQGFYGTERQTTTDIAELLDGVDGKYKYTYADIEKGLNAIIKDEGAENNAISKRIEFYLDQRLRNGYTTVDGIEIPANQEYIDTLKAMEITDYYNNLPITDDLAPVKNVDKVVKNVSNSKNTIAETKQSEKIKDYKIDWIPQDPTKESTYEEIAEVLTEEPKTESDRNKRKWAIFKANVLDKGMVFEDLALKHKNRELMGKWDYTLTSEARGQNIIGQGHYEYDPYTKTSKQISKSLDDIRAEVNNTGLTKEFYEYMYHKHNVDRMSLENRYENTENKPIFGNSVTAVQSQRIVDQYEAQYPEFIEFAQDVYEYLEADKQLLVDNGVISQETADLWSEMYPHYVPTRRTTDTGIDINVPLDTRRTGINAPIKKATGGNSDILPLFDTMAMRTLQTQRAIAKNNFGVELLNTLETAIETNQATVDEVIDSVEAQEELLQEGKKGSNPTFTVFEDGKKVTFEITKDMYDALKPLSDSSLLSKTIAPLNKFGSFHRGVLTEFNPVFMFTNAIKDVQDVLINSQHAAKTYLKIPEAYAQMMTKGYWYQEYMANGGARNSYFDNETNTFKTENKGLSKVLDIPPLSTISKLNNLIEMSPRLAEYIASRQSGRSIETSMLDAARVSTNFKAGGNLTKFLNRNGATFLNASVQGAMQQVRNVREANANGVKGWVNLATKFAIAGLPAILLNGLIWDDDDEYEELSDYVKQNYYIVGKDDNGNFIRIPKGRAVAVIQEAVTQMSNLVTGDDEVDLNSFIDLVINNLAPNNPIESNIFSPITQVATNTAWYGGDLVPLRLQNLPAAEQYDESTDMFSRWIGETFNVSPYKVNYLLDQYTGGVGDVLLPMMTPEAESDSEGLLDDLIAPLKSKFTTNSTFNNQNVSDFYDLKEKLTVQANKSAATDEDVLKNKYINSINAELSELYKQKREIQNSDLSNKEKYNQAKEIQEQINEIAKNALSEYTNVSSASNYSTVGDREYYKRINSEGETEWTKIDDDLADDLENLGLSQSEKNTYFKTRDEINSIDDDSDTKKAEIIEAIKGTGFTDEQKAYLYKKYYNTDTVDTIVKSGINIDAYFDYASKEFVADKDENGKSISGSRKEKVISYINSLDLSIPEKAILIKATNTFKFNDYNLAIIEYVDGLDISYSDKVSILEELDMKVDSEGNVKWD